MGAYLSVPCTSAKTRDRMLAFLDEHYRDVPQIMPWTDPRVSQIGAPRLGKEVCAYAKALDLGYYGGGRTVETRDMADNLLRWIALKVSKTREFEILGWTSPALHYTCYENEPVPLIIQSEFPNTPDPWDHDQEYVRCDEFGWDRSYRGPAPGENAAFDATCSPAITGIRELKVRAEPIIRAELQRLDTLWRERGTGGP